MKITPAHVRNSAFLTVTALAVAGELWAAFDADPGTRPWTDYLTQLPWWLLVPLSVAFAVWLPLHLFEFKARQARAMNAECDARVYRSIANAMRKAMDLRDGTTVQVKPDPVEVAQQAWNDLADSGGNP
jgi:hypothetical protein